MAEEEERPLLRGSANPVATSISRRIERTRQLARRWDDSKWNHFSIIVLTTIDVSCIFASFILSLYLCEHERCGGDNDNRYAPQRAVQSALETISLVISCLFMAELIGSLWGLGPSYFRSWFRCLDATVITASFILETALKHVFEGEVGSTIVILRLWRVFQIVEEFGAGAQEHMAGLYEQIEDLTAENQVLRDQIAILRSETRERGGLETVESAVGLSATNK